MILGLLDRHPDPLDRGTDPKIRIHTKCHGSTTLVSNNFLSPGLAVGVGFGAVGRTKSATFESARNLAIGIGIQNFPEVKVIFFSSSFFVNVLIRLIILVRYLYPSTLCRLHTAFLHWPLSSAATKKV
jgi:hypothetical protein